MVFSYVITPDGTAKQAQNFITQRTKKGYPASFIHTLLKVKRLVHNTSSQYRELHSEF